MTDDDEDFGALFLAECVDLLADLEARLAAMGGGDDDSETLNAAFRAVHSIKGGAAAFGLSALADFAHAVETVMDRLRAGSLVRSPELVGLLLRAADAMAAFVDAGRAGTAPPGDAAALAAELAAALGAPADPDVACDPPPRPAGPSVELLPGPDFLIAGFEPLLVIRAAREIGLVAAEPVGRVPPLPELPHGACPLGWRLTFDGVPPEALRAFFAPYAEMAEVRFHGEPLAEAPAPAAVPAEPTPVAPAPVAPAPVAPPAAPPPQAQAATVRVGLDRLDRLVDLVGEVLIAQAALAQRIAERGDAAALAATAEALGRETRALQESVMAIRAQPLRTVLQRMPRVLRDLGRTLGKEVELVTSGGEVEVDTTVIEELHEPLVHLLRNAMDHGIEPAEARVAAGKPATGTLRLTAVQKGGRVEIALEDDGRGIDRAAVRARAVASGLVAETWAGSPEEIEQLVFLPGFSTAEAVSTVSGRGVGMDVVRQRIQALGGRCTLRSRPGRGTAVTITLPVTLAVMDGMTVRVAGQDFVLPIGAVVEAIRVEPSRVAVLPDRSRLVRTRGAFVPLVSLREALRLPGDPPETTAVVVDAEEGGRVALVVDDLLGQRQLVLKSLDVNVGRVAGVAGATIMGDGRVALVLDVPALIRAAPAQQARMH